MGLLRVDEIDKAAKSIESGYELYIGAGDDFTILTVGELRELLKLARNYIIEEPNYEHISSAS